MPSKTPKTASVLKNGQVIRVYNEEDHGSDYKKLAQEFAAKEPGRVVELPKAEKADEEKPAKKTTGRGKKKKTEEPEPAPEVEEVDDEEEIEE